MGIIGKLRARAAADSEVSPLGAFLVTFGQLLTQIGVRLVQSSAADVAHERAGLADELGKLRAAALADVDEPRLAAVPDA